MPTQAIGVLGPRRTTGAKHHVAVLGPSGECACRIGCWGRSLRKHAGAELAYGHCPRFRSEECGVDHTRAGESADQDAGERKESSTFGVITSSAPLPLIGHLHGVSGTVPVLYRLICRLGRYREGCAWETVSLAARPHTCGSACPVSIDSET